MIDAPNLLAAPSVLDGLQSDAYVSRPDDQIIYLVGEGRLLCDCICTVLRRAERAVETKCESLDELRMRVDCVVRPDLVIVSLPQSTLAPAFAAIKLIRTHWPQTRWIVLSRFADHEFIRHGLKSGVDGFLLEDSPVELLRLVTDLVLLGHSPLPTDVARDLADDLAPREANERVRTTPTARQRAKENNDCVESVALLGGRSRQLSKREREILQCLSRGMSNKIIARELLIAEATVKAHVKALLRKMHVSNRTQAAIRANSFLSSTTHQLPSALLFDDAAPVIRGVAAMADRLKLRLPCAP